MCRPATDSNGRTHIIAAGRPAGHRRARLPASRARGLRPVSTSGSNALYDVVRRLTGSRMEPLMRTWRGGVVLFAAVLLPTLGNAQAFQFRTRSPEVNAASAAWQANGEPILVQGLFYYPTREFRMFDGQVMTQIAVYQNVPVYVDATLAPFGVVYVPVGRDRMRTYERLRTGELAGTTGSRTPTFPVAPASAIPVAERVVGTTGGGGLPQMSEPRTLGTSGATAVIGPGTARTGETGAVGTGGTLTGATSAAPPTPVVPPRTRVESIPRPTGSRGVWLDFNGTRWYSAGAAVPFEPARFTRIGEHRGFSVYREARGASDQIWIAVVQDGPVAPYRRYWSSCLESWQ